MPECKHRYETDVGEKLCQKKLQFDNDSAECSYVAGEEEACIEFDPANLVEYHDRAYAEGQQNPDPKQYANKEELVEEIAKHRRDRQKIKEEFGGRSTAFHFSRGFNFALDKIEAVVSTHGLEE